jgi:DNA (cytosine-5)-methyltransferase 1
MSSRVPGAWAKASPRSPTSAGRAPFRIALSVEKDEIACRTLRLRAIRRHLAAIGELDSYFRLLRGEIGREAFDALPKVKEALSEAGSEVMNAELGKCSSALVDTRIRSALAGATSWILIGGPPCQAYSLAGRARRANDEAFEADEKHFLYREYLRIIKAHSPPIFVMENVKGLLSSHHGGLPMFSRICKDLAAPARGISYEIRSLVKRDEVFGLRPDDYLIESERYGVPQARHRLILLGVRSDLAGRESGLLTEVARPVTVRQTLAGLAPHPEPALPRYGLADRVACGGAVGPCNSSWLGRRRRATGHRRHGRRCAGRQPISTTREHLSSPSVRH